MAMHGHLQATVPLDGAGGVPPSGQGIESGASMRLGKCANSALASLLATADGVPAGVSSTWAVVALPVHSG